MRHSLAIALFAAAGLAVSPGAHAQETPFTFEARVGVAVPVGDWARETLIGPPDGGTQGPTKGDRYLHPGLSLGASIGYALSPTITTHLGYTRNDYRSRHAAHSMMTSGLGLAVSYGFPAAGWAPWMRAALIMHKVTTSWSSLGSFSSDMSPGFEVAGGLSTPIGGTVSFAPSVRYSTFRPRLDGETDHEGVNALMLDAGLRVRF